MIPEILIIILLAGVLIFLLLSTLRKNGPYQENFPEEKKFEPGESLTECPLCGKMLHRGERVHSVVYSKGEDRLMNIYGCPWCYKDHPRKNVDIQRERFCPSCGTHLKDGSFAVARVFERPEKKVHVHVLGCPVCRNRKE